MVCAKDVGLLTGILALQIPRRLRSTPRDRKGCLLGVGPVKASQSMRQDHSVHHRPSLKFAV